MRLRPTLSVRSKLVLSSLFLLAVLSFAFTSALLYFSQQWAEEEVRARAIAFAREIAATIADRREFENATTLKAEARRIMEARPTVRNMDFLAFGEGWPRVVVSTDPTWRAPLTKDQLRELGRGRAIARLVDKASGRHWEVVAPIPLDGSVVGAVAAEFSLAQAERQATRVRRASLAITGLSVLATVLLMGLVVRWVVDRPMRRLFDTIARVERGDRTARVALAQGDEFGRLGGHFDEMLTRLGQTSQEQEERVRQATRELAERYAEVRRLNELLFQAQRRLRHAERLALMGRTVGMVAHEVGTPLHSIAGHLELLRQELPADLRAGSAERRLAIIQAQLVRVGETIEQLLALTRPPAGARTVVDLNACLREVLELTSPGIGAGQVRLETDLAPALPRVSGEPHQLQQAFLNIVTNALDAMPTGGALRVATLAERRDGRPWAVVRIADSGPGIHKDHLKDIFEPFFTTKDVGRGAGLGLFITQQVLREHGGEIEVESDEASGTTFALAFPGVDGAA